jgi:hypothetical protein
VSTQIRPQLTAVMEEVQLSAATVKSDMLTEIEKVTQAIPFVRCVI